MSHSHPAGLLAAYNSLTDKHLAGYFNNTRIRRHLLRSGLITRSGRILSEKEYKLNVMKREHQKYVRECLAQAIFHKVLDMERYHQLEIKKKLETLARKERIPRFKGEHTSRSIENNMPILSPHPPAGPKTNHGHSVLVNERHSSPLTLTAPRPYTAPGNMQPPIRLQPLPSNPAIRTVPKITPGSRPKTSILENEAPFPIGGKKAMMKFRNSTDNSQRMNPYQLPNISSYLMPIPPPPPPLNGKIAKENRSETWRRRRFHPTTAPNGLEPLFTRDSRRIHKTSLHSNAAITMIYLGKNVHLSCDNSDFRDEIKVYQQHCGGENLCVYKGKLLEKETFQFISKRHHGFPFSLTFFLNGMQVNRLSSCCEYKHRKGSRLGGRRGYFGFVCVEKASPCYKCIIAMGLDTKTSSAKHRKGKISEKREELENDMKLSKDREYLIPRRNEMKGKKISMSTIFSAQEIKMGVRDVRTAIEEMEQKRKSVEDVWEDYQENTFKYEYEEDFEVDEEKQNEKPNEEGQADDQMNGMSKSPSDDEKDNLGTERESETSSQKAPDADDNVKDGDDGCSESELEEDKQDIKTASSTSSRSHTYSGDSEDESAVEDREAHDENSADEGARSSSSQELSESDERGPSPLPVTEPLEIKIEDQEIEESDVETSPLPIQESFENVLEEKMEKGTQEVADSLSEKSEKHVSKEAKEEKSKLWELSTANEWVKKAGLPEAQGDGNNSLPSVYDLALGAQKNNLVVEERVALDSNKETKQAAQETYVLEKKEATEEDEAAQHGDADTEEKEGGAVPRAKAAMTQVPVGEWKPMAERPTLEKVTEKRQPPAGKGSGAGTGTGDGSPGQRGLSPTGEAAVGGSVALREVEVPEEPASTGTVPEPEHAVSAGKQTVQQVGLANKAVAPSSECLQGAAAEREAGTLEKAGEADGEAAMSEAGSPKPDVDQNEEDASTDPETMGPVGDAASEPGASSEEAVAGGEERAEERKGLMRAETPLSSSRGEAEASCGGVSEGISEALRKQEQVLMEAESDTGEGRKDALCPATVDAAADGREAERPNAAPEAPAADGAEEPWTRARPLDAQRTPNGEERTPGKELSVEEEATEAPRSGSEPDAKAAASAEAAALAAEEGRPGDPLTESVGTASGAIPGSEESLEDLTAPRKGGAGEGPSEAGDARPREGAAPQDGPRHGGAGAAGAPKGEPAGRAQAPEGTVAASGEAEEAAAKDQHCLAGQGKDADGPLRGRGAGRVVIVAPEDAPEGEPAMAGKLSHAEGDEDPEDEEEDDAEERPLGTGQREARSLVAEEDQSQGGGAVLTEKRELLADPQGPERNTAGKKAASIPDVTGEETWHKGDELLGKATAVERAAVGELTAPPPSTQEAESAPGQDPEAGWAAAGDGGPAQEAGIPEEERPGSWPEGPSESRGQNLRAVATPPAKPSVPGTQQTQEQVVQQPSEPAEISFNNVRA
ncbi:glutamate-rich protein 3 [Lepus europaeus]|uniref:glutamate-rich protein 3 n=1 Tax=Lepus europaeus TaxID=9983 RepID=UPI002B49C1DB|nr:glutamate-rich protein 3 [Lepus europaeus]